jgi:hypothetical protein
MAIVINGSGTVTGISVGGLPDGIVDAGTLATNSVDSAELIDGSIDNSHIDAMAASKLTGALPAISGASLTGISPNTPSFSVYAGATLAMADVDTYYKAVYNTEEWDTNSCIAQGSGATDNRFICPTGHAGKYMFTYGAHMTFSSGSAAKLTMKILKNTTLIQEMWSYNDSHQRAYGVWSVVIDLAEGDYVEVFASWAGYGWSSSSLFLYAGSNFKFQGYKLT